MRHTSFIGSLLFVSAACIYVGCGSSDDTTSGAGGGTSGGSVSGGGTGGTSAAGQSAAGATAAGNTAGGGTTAGNTAAGGTAGGAKSGGNTAGGAPAGGSTAGGAPAGGSTAGGAPAGGNTAAGAPAGGAGGSGPAPTAILCPEPNALNPVNANTVVITDSPLTADTEWTADKTYVVSVPPGAFSTPGLVVAGFKLTIDAGTVVCLDGDNRINVGGDSPGEIHINGTAANPVVFTSMPSSQDATKPDTYNGGLYINDFLGSSVSNLNIWYSGPGGGSATQALYLSDTAVGSDATKPILLDHVTIGQLQSSGFYIGAPLGVDPSSSIHIAGFAPHDSDSPDYAAVGDVNFFAAKSLQNAVTFDAGLPAEVAHISLRTSTSSDLDGPADLYDLGVPYRWSGDAPLNIYGPTGTVLTIHEGTTLQLDDVIALGDFATDQKGDIVLAGSDAKPVILTSIEATPAAGDWNGLLFHTGEFTTATKIDHAQILYAGTTTDSDIVIGVCDDAGSGAIMIEGPIGGDAFPGPAITNTLIAHSLGDGIVAGSNNGGAVLSTDYTAASLNITFQDIAGQHINAAACPTQ